MTGCGKICILVCTSPVVDGHNVLNLKKIGEMVLVDGLISTYTSFGEVGVSRWPLYRHIHLVYWSQ